MHGLKLPCPIRAFLPTRTLWISELERYHWHANSVLLGARYQGVCHCNICVWNGWWLWFLSVWQSAWAPSSEWQGLAVNANGREQLTEKRIIISLHYIYTACLSVSLPSSGPRREQQSVLAMLYLPVLQKTNTFFGVNASSSQGLGSREFLKSTIRHIDSWATTGLWRERVRDDRWVELKSAWRMEWMFFSNFGGGPGWCVAGSSPLWAGRPVGAHSPCS